MGNGGKIWGDSLSHTLFRLLSVATAAVAYSLFRSCLIFFSLVSLPPSPSEKNHRNSERLRLTFVEWTATNPTLFFLCFQIGGIICFVQVSVFIILPLYQD